MLKSFFSQKKGDNRNKYKRTKCAIVKEIKKEYLVTLEQDLEHYCCFVCYKFALLYSILFSSLHITNMILIIICARTVKD